MDIHQLTRTLHTRNDSKIVMMVADGLGGLPMEAGGPTELEAAATPHLDRLASRGVQGASIPVLPGISPGSGPGHLGLFGYDPLTYQIGRGALEATGIGFTLEPGDVAIRCNFCTLDEAGRISDRRAGRIPTEQSTLLVERLRQIQIPDITIFVEPVKEHRFVIVLRGEGLGGQVADTDPQETGVPPLAPRATDEGSQRTAELATMFLAEARKLLSDQEAANFHTMRGFAARPELPTYEEVYGLRAAAIAVYPMYKGLAQLVGMKIVGQPQTLDEQMDVLAAAWDDHDFFFVHFKYTDSTGEDGDFEGKRERTEQFDAVIPRVVELSPDVLIVTGDHSTPSFLKQHSWHPVPTLLVSDCCRPDGLTEFNDSTCFRGGLGQFEAKYLMSLALANAGRLGKYGA
ncbi:MAG: 2,3-bisphosphoglycerate-independent phosphoglycerate mutase [Pirellulaceae bacterium]|nr:2,3-bisphosphoglycerate-independent phosphoglycerate mutase [Pirellulaceae bacterium]